MTLPREMRLCASGLPAFTPPPAAATACARASSVTCAPDSIRAISSRRRASSSVWTLVRVTRPSWLFSISRWRCAARGDLGAVGDDEQLRALRQAVEALADRAGDGAADAAVDLVEDHRPGVAALGQRDLEREDEAGELAAAGDPGQRRERGAGVGRDLELDPVAAARAPIAPRRAARPGSGSGRSRASAARARRRPRNRGGRRRRCAAR